MEFRDNEAIYLQIADYVGSNVLLRKWQPDEKIPSVRDLAMELQVNLNTVMRSYEYLEDLGVIYNKRGLGFFVAPAGFGKVKTYRKERFMKRELPQFFDTLFLLDISHEEILQRYSAFKAKKTAAK